LHSSVQLFMHSSFSDFFIFYLHSSVQLFMHSSFSFLLFLFAQFNVHFFIFFVGPVQFNFLCTAQFSFFFCFCLHSSVQSFSWQFFFCAVCALHRLSRFMARAPSFSSLTSPKSSYFLFLA
jgi:hypothetical protein